MFLGYDYQIMQKMLASFALFLAIFPVQAYAQKNKAQQPSKSDKSSAPTASVAQKQPDSISLQPKNQEHVKDDVWVIKTPEKDGLDKAAFAVSVALLGIALFGVIYAKQTLLAIQGQLAEIKAAGVQTDKMIANAGKHADAAINAARPFILVYTKGDLGTEFWMRNCGRSPAQLLHVDPIMKIEYPKFEGAAQDWAMRPTPFYGQHYETGEQFNVAWLAPGERRCFASIDPNLFKELGPQIIAELTDGIRAIRIYSAIKYRGIITPDVFETRFCYGWGRPRGTYMTGPYGYNKNT